MSRRTSIIKALVAKINEALNGTSPYTTNLYNNAHARLVFWDECKEMPAVYATAGSEMREYMPGDFTWAFLGISLKVYCRGDNAQEELEILLEDIERCVDANRVLVYDSIRNLETTEILIQSITTDEGLLQPYAVSEINLQVRYQLL
jgi:hypothetical protein